MKLLTLIAMLLIIYAGACTAEQAPNYAKLSSELRAQLIRSQLDQVAILVNALSNDQSRLVTLTGEGATINPGYIVGVDIPYAPIYPVTEPFNADLKGIGDNCRILGAIALNVVRKPEEAGKTVPAGVHILLYRPRYRQIYNPTLLFVSIEVDRGGRITFREDYSVHMQMIPGAASPALNVEFPNKSEVEKGAPLKRAKVEMLWKNDGYRFTIDL